MKFFQHFFLALLTALLCTLLPYFFYSSNYLTAGFAKSKVGFDSVLATTPAVNPTQTSSLVQQSQALYEAGQFVEGVQLLKKAVTEFQATNDVLNEAIALSNLSLAYQQLGQWQEATEAITQSIKLLQTLKDANSSQVFAQALDVRGGLELAQGQTEAALNTWQEAAKIYQRLDDTSALVRDRVNQAQAMQALGNYLQADKTLTSVREILQKQPESPIEPI